MKWKKVGNGGTESGLGVRWGGHGVKHFSVTLWNNKTGMGHSLNGEINGFPMSYTYNKCLNEL